MIIPILKGLHSPDLERPRIPADVSDCAVFIQALVGPAGNGQEAFSFTVVTPEFLKHEDCPRWGRGYLVLTTFRWEAVESSVAKLLRHAVRETWSEVAAELNKELHWEFENYRDT